VGGLSIKDRSQATRGQSSTLHALSSTEFPVPIFILNLTLSREGLGRAIPREKVHI